jgi:hypothetical protein
MSGYMDAPAWKKIEALERFHQTSHDKFAASCPGPSHAHGDRAPSLGIVIGNKQQIVLTCFAGCDQEDILAALGCTAHDLYPARETTRDDKLLRLEDADQIYDYTDESPTILFKVARYEPKTFRPFSPDGPRWKAGEAGIRRHVPYRLPDLLAADPAEVVLILEGEKDVDRAWEAGFVATTTHGGAKAFMKSAGELARVLAHRDVAIIPDADDPGEQYAVAVWREVSSVASQARIIHLPGLERRHEHGQDLSDWLDLGHSGEELRRLIQEEEQVGIVLSSVTAGQIDWLWKSYLPLGKVTIIDGDGGFGKTLVLGDIAARVTRNRPMPDGSPGVDGGVIMLNAEDDINDTLTPRLVAAGADLSRIRILETAPVFAENGHRSEAPISLPRDIPTLERAVRQTRAKLVIVDPVMSFLDGGVDSHKDQDARRVTRPLMAFAKRAGVALILVRHISKGGSANPQHRGIASVAWINSARSGLVVGPDPDDPDKRVLALNKTNLAPRSTPSLTYRILGNDQTSLRVEWLGTSHHDARAVLGQYGATTDDKDTRHGFLEAKAFLREELTHGPVPAPEMLKRAGDLSISKRTLDRARAELGVQSKRIGFGATSHWEWSLPAESGDEERHHDGPGNLRADAGDNGACEADFSEDCQIVEAGNLHGPYRPDGNLRAAQPDAPTDGKNAANLPANAPPTGERKIWRGVAR